MSGVGCPAPDFRGLAGRIRYISPITFRHYPKLPKTTNPNYKLRHPKTPSPKTPNTNPQTLRNKGIVAKCRVAKCLDTWQVGGSGYEKFRKSNLRDWRWCTKKPIGSDIRGLEAWFNNHNVGSRASTAVWILSLGALEAKILTSKVTPTKFAHEWL